MRLMVSKADFVKEGLDRVAIKYLENTKTVANSMGKSLVVIKLEDKDDIIGMFKDGEWRLECLVVARDNEPKKYIVNLRADKNSFGTLMILDETHVDKLGIDKEWFTNLRDTRGFIKGLFKRAV